MVERCPGQDARFLKPDDVRDEVCPACGAAVEFFKNDRSRKCPDCGTRFRNPRLDWGCAYGCPSAGVWVDCAPAVRAAGQGTT